MHKTILKLLAELSGFILKKNNYAIASYNFEEDSIWLKELMYSQHHRTVFVHWDAHLENILLLHNPKLFLYFIIRN